MTYQRLCREGGLRIQTVPLFVLNSAIGLDNMSEWLSELLSINMSATRRHITNGRNGICCCVRSQRGTEINVHVNYIVLRREMCILHACYCIVCVCVCVCVCPSPSPLCRGSQYMHTSQHANTNPTARNTPCDWSRLGNSCYGDTRLIDRPPDAVNYINNFS